MTQQAPAPFSTIVFPDAAKAKKWEPKNLTPKHKQILSLYAQGVKNEQIGALCKCTPQLVVMLATSQAGKDYLSFIEQQMDHRLRALYHKSIDAIDDQLTNGSGENKLKAAKLQMQAIGKLGRTQDEAETAEDVISRIMNMQVNGDINIQVNQGDSSGSGS